MFALHGPDGFLLLAAAVAAGRSRIAPARGGTGSISCAGGSGCAFPGVLLDISPHLPSLAQGGGDLTAGALGRLGGGSQLLTRYRGPGP